ncbi:MAG: IS21-like element helper ATPase IstB [Burkholderiales bacterium]
MVNLLLDKIAQACESLKLTGILSSYQSIADNCAKEGLSYTEYLAQILNYETVTREQRKQQTLLKLAGFPKAKKLEEFDFTCAQVNHAQIQELATLRFMHNNENVILLGPSGTGKTHLAIGLGYIATQQERKVKFITAADLMLQMQAAHAQNKLDKYLNRYVKTTRILIIDEFGYLRFNEQQANFFFQLVNKRYETGSLIITSNLTFTKWKEVLNDDEALTAAILDRLIHHSSIVLIQGDSYRLKQKKKAGILPASLINQA